MLFLSYVKLMQHFIYILNHLFVFISFVLGCVNDREKQLQQILKPFPGQKKT